MKNMIEFVNNSKMNGFFQYFIFHELIQNYTFYLYKEPELIEIFDSLEVLKTWSSPISNYCNRVLENIINENYFQGISLLNKLRQDYYLDLIDDGVTSIDTKLFKWIVTKNIMMTLLRNYIVYIYLIIKIFMMIKIFIIMMIKLKHH